MLKLAKSFIHAIYIINYEMLMTFLEMLHKNLYETIKLVKVIAK